MSSPVAQSAGSRGAVRPGTRRLRNSPAAAPTRHGTGGKAGKPAPASPRIVLIDDDVLYREALERNLTEQRFHVISFGDGASALEHLRSDRNCDIILLDWQMPEMSGIDVLRGMRAMALELPVIVLTAFASEQNEALALDCGAVDFFSKARSPSILVRRLRIIIEATRPASERDDLLDVIRVKSLELRLSVKRALWRGVQVPLTVTEFNIVKVLASRAGDEVSYRDIYNVVHGDEFVAGDGINGYRTNVRALIKRIRQKFRDLDGGFAEVENYPGFGYRWRPDSEVRQRARTAQACATDSEVPGPLHRLARRCPLIESRCITTACPASDRLAATTQGMLSQVRLFTRKFRASLAKSFAR